MRDWEAFVRRHLSLPDLKPEREERIVRELAAQLEDFYRDAISRGVNEEEADALAERQIRDWECFACEVRRADRPNVQSRFDGWTDKAQGPPRHKVLRALTAWMCIDGFAVRRLLKSPRFTLATLLTLGIGIGANTALFSVVYSVLLNPLPYEDPEQLFFAWETRDEGSRTTSVSLGNFAGWRDTSSGGPALAAARWRAFNVTGGDRPYRVDGLEASADLLSLLGTRLLHGREFSREEEQPGDDAVCLVSHSFWQERLGANPNPIGLRLTLNGRSHAVVGVLPEAFEVPGLGPSPILTPLTLDPSHPGYWSNHNTRVLGRLTGEATLDRANEALSLIASRLEEAHPQWNEGIGAQLVPAREQLVQGARRTLWILFGAVGFILLIACVNVASLLLTRAVAAEKEIAVRMALGADRWRIVRLVLSEAFLLSAGGGLLGLLISYWGVETIQRWGPGNLPRLNEVSVSAPVLWFTLACAVGTGLLFGLVPALRSSRLDIQTSLNKGGRSPGLGSQHRIQRAFVIAEVAIAVMLLNGSGLLLQTFKNLLDVNLGFESEGRVVLQVTLSESRYTDHARVTAFLDQLHERLDAIPGVQRSGSSVGLPFQWMMWRQYLTVEGKPARTLPEVPVIDLSISTPGYVRTLGIPSIRGRMLLDSDGPESQFVALVNETFVRTHLGGENVIGRRLRFSPPDALLPPDRSPEEFPWYTIVGVVGDVRRWNLTSDAFPEVYISQRQDMGVAREFFVVVHTSMPGETTAGAMRQAVWDIDPNQPVSWVQPIDAMFSSAVAQPRFNAALVGAFGLTALILAAIGVYGLMAHMVCARTQEIGVRIALGARPEQILKHVGGQGILAALGGIGVGLAGSVATARLMASMLFGIEPVDAPTLLFVVVTVLLVAVAAALVPSWRAAKMDATAALTTE